LTLFVELNNGVSACAVFCKCEAQNYLANSIINHHSACLKIEVWKSFPRSRNRENKFDVNFSQTTKIPFGDDFNDDSIEWRLWKS